MTADGEAEDLAGQVDIGGGPGATREFRTTPRQLRNLLIAVVIAFGVAVAAGFIAFIAKSAGATNVAVIGGLGGLIFLYAYLAYASARTMFGPRGISGRNLGGRYEYRWADRQCRLPGVYLTRRYDVLGRPDDDRRRPHPRRRTSIRRDHG